MMADRKRAKPTTDAVEILRQRYFEGKPEMEATLEEERAKTEVARLVYDLRDQAGLTQKELAKRVGTTASVISRLEDADYNGHSLTMLRRIAEAVGQCVQIRFVPLEQSPRGKIDLPGKDLPPESMASRPGMDRWPDEPILSQEVSAPFDLPRPGTPVRCMARPGTDRIPDPPLPGVGADADHV
jgi:transcriptional regulator with XRE-family HTH domain